MYAQVHAFGGYCHYVDSNTLQWESGTQNTCVQWANYTLLFVHRWILREAISGGQLQTGCFLQLSSEEWQHYGLREAYIKAITQIIQQSVSIVRSRVKKCKATGTVPLWARSGGPKNASVKQRRVKHNPQTTIKELQGQIAAYGPSVYS